MGAAVRISLGIEMSAHPDDDTHPVGPMESGGEFVGLLKGVLSGLRSEIDRRLVSHDLTDAQWMPLVLIWQGRCSTAAEIARESDCDAGAVTRTISRLEEKALLTRVRSRSDRRVVELQLTDSGRALAARVPPVLTDVLNLYLGGFDRTEWRLMLTLLWRLRRNGESED